MGTPEATPGWHPDPTGRHRWRWFDGHGWSARVADETARALTDRTRPPGRRGGLWQTVATLVPAATLVAFIYFATQR